MHFLEPKVTQNSGLKRWPLFGIPAQNMCAIFFHSFRFSLPFFIVHLNVLLILCFAHSKFICAKGSGWLMCIRWTNKKSRYTTVKKKRCDHCKLLGRGQKNTLTHSHKSPAPISQRQRACIESRNIGELNTFHLIFAFWNSTFSRCTDGIATCVRFFSSALWGFSIRFQPIDADWIALPLFNRVESACRIATSVSLTFIYCNWINRQ